MLSKIQKIKLTTEQLKKERKRKGEQEKYKREKWKERDGKREEDKPKKKGMGTKKNRMKGNQCNWNKNPIRHLICWIEEFSSAEQDVCPSVSSNFSKRGAVEDSSLAFGAETLRTFCICRTIGPSTWKNKTIFTHWYSLLIKMACKFNKNLILVP